jgi:hypothetical protein
LLDFELLDPFLLGLYYCPRLQHCHYPNTSAKPLPLDRLRILPHLFLLPLFIVLWCNDYGIRDVFRGILIGIELCCRVPCHQTCFMTVGPSCYHIPIYRVICYFTHRYGGLRRNVLLKMGFTIMPIERLTHP